MIDGYSFSNQNHWPIVAIGALLVFVFFLWKEWKDPKRGWFMFNSSIAFFAIFALVLIFLEPTREIEVSDSKALILTDGFDMQQKDSLQKTYKGIALFSYDPKKSIRTALDSLTEVFVLGNGIKPFDFWQYKDIPVAYLPAKVPKDISELTYAREIYFGQTLKIEGRYHQPKRGTTLVLNDPAGNGLDSVQFTGTPNNVFSVQSTPKVLGKLVYSLTEKDSLGILKNSQPIPVRIHKKEELRVLILNNFPTFETKYLKNVLAENGHKVVVRSQLTQGKYKFEYFNTPVSPIYQLTNEVLDDFDVVIVDADTYMNFGKGITAIFEKSIREDGVGLFIQPNDTFFDQGMRPSYFEFRRDNINEFNIAHSKTVLEKYPYSFELKFSVQPIQAKGTQIFAAYKPIGRGRVATTTLGNTYQMLLEGSDTAYNNFWTSILDKVARTNTTSLMWKSKTDFPRVDMPFEYEIRTAMSEFQIMDQDSMVSSLKQDNLIPTVYTGKKYPRKLGWNELSLEGDSTSSFSYYVFNNTDWNSLEISRNIAANQKEFKAHLEHGKIIKINKQISPIFFYILFVLGISWLWLHPKLFEN